VCLGGTQADAECGGCRDRLHLWLLRIVGALTAPTSMTLPCRWRSRPQHQKLTHAPQQKAPAIESAYRRATKPAWWSAPPTCTGA
jgi:hypothetical protein